MSCKITQVFCLLWILLFTIMLSIKVVVVLVILVDLPMHGNNEFSNSEFIKCSVLRKSRLWSIPINTSLCVSNFIFFMHLFRFF